MNKKSLIALITLFVVLIVSTVVLSLFSANEGQQQFANDGYVLNVDDIKKVEIESDTTYKVNRSGVVSFSDAEGTPMSIESENFVHLADDSIMAFSDGILLDFDDLSENFINNYYVSKELQIKESANGYTVDTQTGTLAFGEHVWKVSDDRYIIRSNTLDVYFSDEDIREVSNFVEISVNEDGIVSILTEDNIWTTISEECYILTEDGVKIYPITKIIEDGAYKITMSKLVISPDDSILLTEDETRRQIVPELNIEAIDGEDGTDGESGEDGTSGEDGESGTSGTNGSSGSSGLKGDDAILESTTNSELPQMSIGDWNITENSLKGMIQITDGLTSLEVSASDTNSHDGRVFITNMKTGEIIPCYSVVDGSYNEGSITDPSETGFPEFKDGVDEVYFSTLNGPLEPNTEYKLSVVAYYTLNDIVYSREFITRIFYTDSTGANVVHNKSEEDKLDITLKLDSTKVATTAAVEVFVLTYEQNKNFNLATGNNASNYTQKIEVNYQAGSITRFNNDGSTEAIAGATLNPLGLVFDDLNSNTEYVIRTIVKDTSGLTLISKQELEVMTLKVVPTWGTITSDVQVNYNRATGGFEVFRPNVIDTQNGAVKYVYTAYNGTEEVMSQTVLPNEPQPVEFFLEGGKDYTIKVEMHYDDNEKIVIYDLGTSEVVKVLGDTIPKIILDAYSLQYNSIQGDITLHLNSSSSLTVDALHPLTISIYADQVIKQDIILKDGNPVTVDGRYTVTYNVPTGGSSNEEIIDIEFDNLYKNTNYTITIKGFLNLGDGNGVMERVIGTTSFQTKDTNRMGATWKEDDTQTTQIKQILNLEALEDASDSDVGYATNELKYGKVNVLLFKGTGYDRELIGDFDVIDQTDLENLYGSNGLLITENNFGVSTLSAGTTYMIMVNEIVDATYNMDLGYINDFDEINDNYNVLTAKATPPDLTKNPSIAAITTTPILNEDANKYGAKYNPDLLDDAIIGYRIESNYDNSQRLATEVTYYIFEYQQFYNALKAETDPIKAGAIRIKEITLPVTGVDDNVPAIAMFFNDVEFNSVIGEGSFAQNAFIYEGPSDFTRGYRYAFAYTAEFSDSGNVADTKTYPYDHSDYEVYKNLYGAGRELETTLGIRTAYILNSGMVSAPKGDPVIYSYVFDTPNSTVANDKNNASVTIHYKYQDLDETIVDTPGNPITQIKFENEFGVESSMNINATPVNTGNGWYQVTIPYVMERGDVGPNGKATLSPEIAINRYLNPDYERTLQELTKDPNYEDEAFYLAHVPVEWGYGADLSTGSMANAINIEMIPVLEENYITFELSDKYIGSQLPRETLVERAYSLKLTVDCTSNSTIDDAVFYIPVETNEYGITSSKFSTSQLGNEYLDETFEFTAEVLYDSGMQGWAYADETLNPIGLFGLQRTNILLNSEPEYILGSYSTYPNRNTQSPANGLIQLNTRFDIETLRNTVKDEKEDQVALQKYFTYTSAQNIGFTKYLSIQHFGVADNNSSNLEHLSGYHVVPKGVASYPLTFKGENSTTLTQLIPTVGELDYDVSITLIDIQSFQISGFSELDQPRVNISVYKTIEDASDLLNNYVGKITLDINADGEYIYSTADNANRIDGLSTNTEYYMVISAVVDGKETILLDTQTTEKAIYTFETHDGLKITPNNEGAIYYNFSYFEKNVQLYFTLNQFLGVDLKYDIFLSESAALNNEAPYITNQELLDLGLIEEKPTSNTNMFDLNLTPSINREKFATGVEYFLRITAMVGSNEETKVTVVEPFFIDGVVDNISSMIYANEATAESISFMVSLTDLEYSLMLDKNMDVASNPSPIYTVRFTDNNGNRIYTKYDEEVYYLKDLQTEFILDDDALRGNSIDQVDISPETIYQIHIYAVPDYNHDGLSGNTIPNDNNSKKDWQYFFNDAGNQVNKYPVFNDFIDTFWINSGPDTSKRNSAMAAVEANFLIASRSQTTTPVENILINKDMATIFINQSDKFELTLAESYGITTINEYNEEIQSFKKITYSITGTNYNGHPVSNYGEAIAPRDPMFTKTKDNANYDVFTYVLPHTVARGLYQVTIKLYVNETDLVPYETLSFTSRS